MTGLLIRDLRLAIRAGGGFGLGLAFFLIVTILMPFGIGPETGIITRIAPGILWIGALLACLLSLDRIFALDWEDGSLDLLATSPLPLEMVLGVKALAHWLTTGLPLVLAAPVLGVLLNLPGAGYGWLVLSLAVGTPALSVIGMFGAALTVGLKRGGLLLSLLVLPLYVPTLIFGAETARRGAVGMEAETAFIMLAGITLGAVALLPFAAAATDRLEPDAILRVLAVNALDGLGQGLGQFLDGVEVDAALIPCGEHLVCKCFQITIGESGLGNIETFSGTQRAQRFRIRVLSQQCQSRAVINTRSHRDAGFQCRTLGLVLKPGVVDRAGARTNEIEPR